MMKAVAVFSAGGARLIDVPKPDLEAIDDGRGVLVKVLAVGVDGTERKSWRVNTARPGGIRLSHHRS